MIIRSSTDTHFRTTRPVFRTDKNYLGESLLKFSQIFNGADAVFHAGDFVHSSQGDMFLLAELINFFDEYKEVEFYLTPGQHDLRFHKYIEGSVIGILNRAVKNFHIMDPEKPIFLGKKKFVFQSCWWNHKIPKPVKSAGVNVLVIHRMFIPTRKEKLYPGQKALSADTFLKKHGFDIIISGDNHNHFYFQSGNRIFFNGGSLMRSGADQLGHCPQYLELNTERLGYEIHEIKIKPAKEVFDLSAIKRRKKLKKEKNYLDSAGSFIRELEMDRKSGSAVFRETAFEDLKKYDKKKRILGIIEQIFNEAEEL